MLTISLISLDLSSMIRLKDLTLLFVLECIGLKLVLQWPAFLKYLENTFENMCSEIFTNLLGGKPIVLFYTRRLRKPCKMICLGACIYNEKQI